MGGTSEAAAGASDAKKSAKASAQKAKGNGEAIAEDVAESRHFREKAGATSWDKREGSANIKAFIEGTINPSNNSTQGSRKLAKQKVRI